MPDVRAAVGHLAALKGVGPATASAVLAAYAPEAAAFMSDEAMEAVLDGPKEYTLRRYLSFAEALQAKAKELGRLQEAGAALTTSDLERALWATAVLETKKPQDGGARRKAPTRRSAAKVKEPKPPATPAKPPVQPLLQELASKPAKKRRR
eukprot:SM000018S03709  [mRNA]  locus=s18:971871:972639:+ [translate_table: standard]